jgi:hypothetical protein
MTNRSVAEVRFVEEKFSSGNRGKICGRRPVRRGDGLAGRHFDDAAA